MYALASPITITRVAPSAAAERYTKAAERRAGSPARGAPTEGRLTTAHPMMRSRDSSGRVPTVPRMSWQRSLANAPTRDLSSDDALSSRTAPAKSFALPAARITPIIQTCVATLSPQRRSVAMRQSAAASRKRPSQRCLAPGPPSTAACYAARARSCSRRDEIGSSPLLVIAICQSQLRFRIDDAGSVLCWRAKPSPSFPFRPSWWWSD